MTKEQVIKIFKKHERAMFGKDCSCKLGVCAYCYETVATEIISLYQTGKTDVVIDPEKETLKEPVDPREKEMLGGYNLEPIPGVNE